ncbi:lipid A phosphoethanolamine transferase [Campylobacter sp. JMF_04 NA10]|uniref:phosphoethanolamine transferase n=1 Tax=Campylobacter sp. JMF_04 NA10 TaxID=2983824 RepID=UPI0022E9ECDC|nr:phosphoethanolamine transferase [Campylobacter sp. JMF_04 NA10]MDA3077105.1 lipid A phosphoethanolamine transferase [Campylobacter sp. JMF_04 NA10]
MKDLNFINLRVNSLNFFVLFALSYMLFVSLAYVLAKGMPVAINIVKFFFIDMIFVSAFIAIGGGLWRDERAFFKKFCFIFLLISIPLFLNFTTPSLLINRSPSLNFAFFAVLAFVLLIVFRLIKFKIARILLFVLMIIPSAFYLVYFSQTGGVFNEYSLIAILQSEPGEAIEYLNTKFNLYLPLIIAFFILSYFVIFFNFERLNFVKFDLSAVLKVAICVLLAFDIFTKFNFRKMQIYAISLDKANEFLQSLDKFKQNENERISGVKNLKFSDEKALYVLVIGESQNKNHMSVYGYKHDTTPFLREFAKQGNSVFFTNAFSNHSFTIHVLYQFMTARNQYNEIPQEKAISLIELAKMANFETIYISNQAKHGIYGSPLSMLFASANQKFWLTALGTDRFHRPEEPYDEKILPKIDEMKFGDKTLLILHLMGAHWKYEARYPKDFVKFESKYDNAVLYNDFIVQKIYEKVRKMPNFKALVYCADHGEDMLYQHDSSNFTMDMAQIPFFAYFSDDWIALNSQKFAQIKANANEYFTNDLIFNFISGIMGIKSSVDEPYNDISGEFYDANKSRFKTLHGKRKILE